MFDSIIREQFAALQPELATMTEQAVEKVMRKHGLIHDECNHVLTHEKSAIISLINAARDTAQILSNETGGHGIYVGPETRTKVICALIKAANDAERLYTAVLKKTTN